MHTRLSLPRRLAVTLAALASIFGMTLVATPAAQATVHGSCASPPPRH